MSHSSVPRSQFGSLLSTTTKNRKKLIAALGLLAFSIVVFRVSVITVRSHGAPVGPVSSPTVAAADELEGNVAVFNKLFPTLAVRESENQGFYRLLHHRWASVPLAPIVTASKSDALFTDVDGDLQADPGDTLKYTVTINASGEDATGVNFTDTVDPNTAFVGGSLTATPVAVNDSYQAIGNVRIQVPVGSGVLANDFLGLPNATITGAPTNSTNGGNVTLNADGSFSYNPPAGFEGNDTFSYTLTNSEGSNNATVTITVSGMIWFVNSAATCPCDGRLTNPFIELTGVNSFAAGAADDPGDNIFLYSGSYTGGVTLLNNQRVIGQGAGASIASITGITVPSFSDPLPATGGARPTVANAAGSNILLASGNYLRGFDIGNSAASGSAISGTGIGTLTVTELAISGTGRALNLDTGTLGVTIDSISSSNSTTNGVTLNNVGGVLSVTGSTTVTNASQEGIKISNISNIGLPSFQFGAVTIASRNATGILLDEVDNSGGTMSFGATSIPNPNAAGGYGIRVEDSSAPVTFASATISDANVVTAQSDGDLNGIADNDGDGDAIFLKNNAGSFTLNGGSLSNCGNDCIDLRDSSALVLSGVNISLPGIDIVGINGAGFGGHGISAINLTGTSSITGGTVSGWNVANKDGLYLVNTTSTALALTIHGATFQNSTGNRGIGIQGRSAANMTVTVGGATNNPATNCTFSNISGTALQSSAGVGAGSTATVNLTVQNSTFQSSPTDGKTNLVAGVVEAGKSNVVIRDNTFSNVFVTASTGEALININQDGTLAGNQLGVTIQRNNINNVGSAANNCAGGAVPCRGPGNAILVFIDDQANVPNTIVIDDNTLTNVQQGGIFLDMNNAGANASDVAARIINNCIGKLRVAGICTGLDAPVGQGAAGRGIGVDRRQTGGKQANVLIDGNTIRNGNGGNLGTLNTPGIFARAQGTTNSSVTLTNNNIDTNFVGAAEMRLDSAGTATQCSDINGNTFPAAALATIDINEAAGSTHNVEQASAAAVQAANGGLVTVTPDAGVAFGVACAAPPMARLFNWSNRDTFAMLQGGAKSIPQAKAQSSRAAKDRNVVSRKADKLHHASVRRTESNEANVAIKSAEEIAAKRLNDAVKAVKSAGVVTPAMLADVNLAIGTLPAGESVTITFRVTVDNPFLGAMAQVSNQGTVSGTNFADVLTDDPTVGGTADPTVTPIDLPEVSVAVSPLSVAEDGGTNLVYTFTREAPTTNAMTVNFSIGGTATFGASPNDYTQTGAATFSPPNGTVTFAAGSATATVTVDPEADTTVEPDETVILTVTAGVGYAVGSPSSATGTITNDDADVSVAVSPLSVAEDGATNLVYTFTRTGATAGALTVNFSIGGTATFGAGNDYTQTGATTFTPPTGSVTFTAGNATAQVTVDPEADTTVEPDETVILTVTAGTGYNVGTPSSATGTITNDDADVSIAVSPASVTEDGATNLVYTFTRTGFTGGALVVNFTIGGTATFGASPNDYTQTGATTFTPPTGTVTFGAGNSTAQITVDPETDAIAEADETVTLTLAAGTGYNVVSPSSATGTILNDDTVVSVVVSPASSAEGGANLVYTFTRTGSTGSSLTVNFSVGGTASFPADYSQSGAATFTPPNATVTIGAGNSSAAVNVTPLTDCLNEGNETVEFTVQPGTGYGVGSPSTATGTIVDVPDTTAPVITLDPNRPMSMWPPDHDYQSFTVTDFVQSASDNCDPNVDVSDVFITKITSDEAENGAGDGNTINDITIAANCKDFQLRAERSVVGNGRVYTIHFKVVDSNGNVGTATATVIVSLSFGGSAIDSGPVYTVMSVCP